MLFLPPKMKTYLVSEDIMFYVAFMPVQYDCNVVSDVRSSSSKFVNEDIILCSIKWCPC